MSYDHLRQTLERGEVVIIDGGTGTELERRGAPMDPEAWCGPATLDHVDLLERIHRDYIDVGARVITTNTYASSRLMLSLSGSGDRFDDLNKAAVAAALRARDASGVDGVAVAGSVSHMVPMAAGTDHADRSRNPSPEQLADASGELAALLAREGCDLMILEMMFHPERMPIAFDAALATGLPVWAGLSARRGADEQILSYTTEAELPFAEIVALAARYPVDAMGVMHSHVDLISGAVELVRAGFDGPLLAYPDSGRFEMPGWRFVDLIDPAELRGLAAGWRGQGVQILGGCCGLSPHHIEALAGLTG